jgi:hypothetical protein
MRAEPIGRHARRQLRLRPRGCENASIKDVIPGRAQREPGISRFRVWSFGPSRNDGARSIFADVNHPLAAPALENRLRMRSNRVSQTSR